MESRLIRITKILIDAMFYMGIILTAGLYFIISIYGRYNQAYAENIIGMTVMFTIGGIFAVLIVAELRKMFRSVLTDDCFVRANVVSLKKMGNYSFIIAFIAFLRMFLYLTPALLVVIVVFLICGLFSKVLSQVFEKAIDYKIENDLTI